MTFVLERIASPEEIRFLTSTRPLDLLEPPRPLTHVNHLVENLRPEFSKAQPKPDLRRLKLHPLKHRDSYKVAIVPPGVRMSDMCCTLRECFTAWSKQHDALNKALTILKAEFGAKDVSVKFVVSDVEGADEDGEIVQRGISFVWLEIIF